MIINEIKEKLKAESISKKANILQSFFKTGIGEYAQGDIFLGVTVPKTRKIAKQFFDLREKYIKELLESKYHEHRLLALLIMVEQFRLANQAQKKQLYSLYIKNTKHINNWDLVDLTAPKIMGEFLFENNRQILYKFALSDNLWQKRIAIITTFSFIKKDDFNDTFKIAKILLHDPHDLIHKAVGWMLREVGKRDLKAEEGFLKKHYKQMPRTMLRYAIEKFAQNKRQAYLNSRI
ncbi:MAG: DNA alkylation repair protein [Candidatus Omnitrophota bacterium]